MNKIIAIVVTYNRKELLKESIEALLNQTYKDFDILIVDNASTDGTYEEVVKKYENKRLKYINTGANIGGSGGFNIGMKEAILKKYEFAWLMDDDSITMPTALESLVKKADILKNEFSYLSSIVKWIDDSICEMNKQIINANWVEDYQYINYNLISLERCSFVSCFINLEVAKKIGLPIKDFFIYGDDWEYTLRLIKEKKAFLDCDSVVIHKMKNNTTASIIDIPKEKISRCYYNYRNTFYINKKIDNKQIIKYIVRYFIDVIEIMIHSPNSRLRRIAVMTRGMVVGIFFNPKIEYISE